MRPHVCTSSWKWVLGCRAAPQDGRTQDHGDAVDEGHGAEHGDRLHEPCSMRRGRVMQVHVLENDRAQAGAEHVPDHDGMVQLAVDHKDTAKAVDRPWPGSHPARGPCSPDAATACRYRTNTPGGAARVARLHAAAGPPRRALLLGQPRHRARGHSLAHLDPLARQRAQRPDPPECAVPGPAGSD